MKYGVSMNTYGVMVPGLGRVRNTTTLSKAAKQRLKWLEFYDSHGQNARLTCRHFGISPDVFYRWKKRYNRGDLKTLEDTKSRKPRNVRKPTTDPLLVARVRALREQYPRWGKKKLYAMVKREGFNTCESTVGRILNRLRARGLLNEPAVVTARLAGKKRRQLSKRPHAKRRDWDYVPKAPGDLVQVDTLHVVQEEGSKRYQFTASDYISKFTARAVGNNITSTAASRIVEAIFDRLPVKPRAIQVDGGSEFMAVFEKTCQLKGITLYVLPPHSPKLNGVVERMNRTSREEIYDLGLHALTNITEHDNLLKEQDYIYNHIRPHEALGMKTPQEYYDSTKVNG
jgi:transposase InsO family protein